MTSSFIRYTSTFFKPIGKLSSIKEIFSALHLEYQKRADMINPGIRNMFNPIDNQGTAKGYSIRYMPWCQISNALQEGQGEVVLAEVSTTTIYSLRYYQQRLKNQNQNQKQIVTNYIVHLSTADQW